MVPLEQFSWFFALIVHFQEWFLIVSATLIFSLPWVSKHRSMISILSLVVVCFNSWTVLPYWISAFQENTNTAKTPAIDVFYANVNSQNGEKQRLMSYLQEKNPDFVLLVEINKSWMNEIKKMESDYPYAKAIVRENNFGMAVLSKKFLEVENVFVDKENMIPALALKAKSSIGELNLVLLHGHPPIGRYATVMRDQYLDVISRRVADLKSPLLVCGDFNTTPWSSIFQKFLSNSDIKYDKKYLPFNTWPALPFLGLPIDHCLAKGLNFLQYRKGEGIGSDHLPLMVRISRVGRTLVDDEN